mmetsp:Transcript_5951/g.4489  ORF Transcript_5951/g.4489 Transcript_5951/m.4489 type:complete len:101 (+) Transcript_5951:1-303(+)
MEPKVTCLDPCQLVRSSARKVMRNSKVQVKINDSKIKEFIVSLKEKASKGFVYEKWSKYHINPNDFPLEQVLSYVFVVDAMNFCFWPNHTPGEFEYENMT